jgi:Plasmid protein of unknown function (Plasmid_RAQPRD)
LNAANNEMANRYLIASVRTALDSAQQSMDAIRAVLPEPVRLAAGERMRFDFSWQRQRLQAVKTNISTMAKETQ